MPPPLQTAIIKAIVAGRATGKFNLADKNLEQLPAELWDADLPLPAVKTAASTTQEAPNWWEVNAPQRLDVSHNRLSGSFPDDVCAWSESLTYLDMSHNQLTTLPTELERLQLLSTLNVSNSKIQAVPTLPASLVIFQGQYNMLTSIPISLAACKQLSTLDLSHNTLYQVPPEVLLACTALVHLNLSHNKLALLPDAFTRMTRLQTLSLEFNRLSSLPASLGACGALVELNAGYNVIKALPAELAGCTALSNLVMGDNQIAEFPGQLCSLQLRLLDLRNCDLSGLPSELGLMTSLRSLLVEGNGLRTIRRTLITGPTSNLLAFLRSRISDNGTGNGSSSSSSPAVRSGNVFGFDAHDVAADMARKLVLSASAQDVTNDQQAMQVLPGRTTSQQNSRHHQPSNQRQQLGAPNSSTAALQPAGGPARGARGQELVLVNAGLCEVPEDVWQALPVLSKLDLSNNQIKSIPAEALTAATNLRTLLLCNLPITCWPLPLIPGALPSLRQLSVTGCSQINNFPENALVCCADTLQVLNMSGVPAASKLSNNVWASLVTLEDLDLSRTRLQEFPQGICTLAPTMRVLKLAGNSISALPEMSNFTRLEELHVANNNLSNLPPTLGLLSDTLRSLTVDGNPIRSIRRTVLESGTPRLLEYLKDRIPIH